jgi:radical SAM superfamily enzyme
MPELALEEYAASAGEMIRHTPKEIVYHRISASARRPTLLAPLWCEIRWNGMQAVGGYLQRYGGQGSGLDEKRQYRP